MLATILAFAGYARTGDVRWTIGGAILSGRMNGAALAIGLGTLVALALDGSASIWLALLVGAALAPASTARVASTSDPMPSRSSGSSCAW